MSAGLFFGVPVRRAILPSRRGVARICSSAGTRFRPPAKLGTPARRAISPSRRGVVSICCPAALYFALRRSLGRLRGARQGGACYGAAPPSRPPLHPPRSTPIRRAFNFLSVARATRHLLRELPSLAPLAQVISLRAALMPEDAFALNASPFQPNTTSYLLV